ncbi:MAG: hypothetical protein Fur003_0900 [Candidatus Dojkabacteria bacterium]
MNPEAEVIAAQFTPEQLAAQKKATEATAELASQSVAPVLESPLSEVAEVVTPPLSEGETTVAMPLMGPEVAQNMAFVPEAPANANVTEAITPANLVGGSEAVVTQTAQVGVERGQGGLPKMSTVGHEVGKLVGHLDKAAEGFRNGMQEWAADTFPIAAPAIEKIQAFQETTAGKILFPAPSITGPGGKILEALTGVPTSKTAETIMKFAQVGNTPIPSFIPNPEANKN